MTTCVDRALPHQPCSIFCRALTKQALMPANGTAPRWRNLKRPRQEPPRRFVMTESCPHLEQEHKFTSTKKHVCEECVKTGDTWVHLRLCMDCGHVGCCDSSKNKHATKHFHSTKHPVIRSAEPGESWTWCFVD